MVRSKTNFYPFPLRKMFKVLRPIRRSAWFRCAKYSKGTEIVSFATILTFNLFISQSEINQPEKLKHGNKKVPL